MHNTHTHTYTHPDLTRLQVSGSTCVKLGAMRCTWRALDSFRSVGGVLRFHGVFFSCGGRQDRGERAGEEGARRGRECCCMPLLTALRQFRKTISLSCSVFLLQQLRTTSLAAQLAVAWASAVWRCVRCGTWTRLAAQHRSNALRSTAE